MGIYHRANGVLASVNLAVLDARRGIIWQRAVRSALHKSFVSSGQHGFGFSAAPTPDSGKLAERVCGGAVCLASVARGIRGVDFGAQRRFKHVLRNAVTGGLCVLCARNREQGAGGENIQHPVVLLVGGFLFCTGPDEQADAGDAAVGDVAAGLVAVETICDLRFTIHDFTSGLGKDSVLPAERDFVRGDVYRAAKFRRGGLVDEHFTRWPD